MNRRLVFISVLTPAQEISCYSKEELRLNIAGEKISPVLLALIELAIGYYNVPYCLNRNFMNVGMKRNLRRLDGKDVRKKTMKML
jgi:hypothetical protein